jgi:phosphoserine phosphatase
MLPVRVAILDIDGTLHPGSLGLRMLESLVARSLGDGGQAEAVFAAIARYRAGALAYPEMVRAATAAYASAVAGLRQTELRAIAAEVWEQEREKLFPFARPMVQGLLRAGFSPFVISSSPEEIVSLLADDLGKLAFSASRFQARDGVYTGACDRMPAEVGKERLLREQFSSGSLDLARSFAIGNSPADADVLSCVGHPVAFEPEPTLAALAAERGWFIADRSTLLRHVTEIVGD